MQIKDILQRDKTTISFEFFPPKTNKGEAALIEKAHELKDLAPSFISVTYGAGGATREKTKRLVMAMKDDLNYDTVAHLTCIGASKQELIDLLQDYKANGVENILALGGDHPKHIPDYQPHPEGLTYASELVEVIREVGDFGIAVAGYPEGHIHQASKIKDLDYLKQKVDKGADCIVTQLFFDNRDFYDFRERCELVGINIPIIAGIMPPLSKQGIERMAGMCGSRIPAKLMRRFMRAGDDENTIEQIGLDWATTQCMDLLDNQVNGIHFYTLNRSNATLEIYRRLGASTSADLIQRTQY